MSVDQTPEAPHHHYDPLLDERPRRKKKVNVGLVVGLIISVLVHAALFYYLWKSKFHPHYLVQEDTAVKVDLLAPPPPPPPPAAPHEPPPIQPRPSPPPPVGVTAPPLPLPPVPHPQPTPPNVVRQAVPPSPPAPVAPSAPPEISHPNWITPPNGDDLADLYPDRAQRMEKEGRASIRCTVTVRGTLTGCSVASEDPPGFGFGDATIQASRRWKMKPATSDGKPVEGVVTVPLSWKLAGG